MHKLPWVKILIRKVCLSNIWILIKITLVNWNLWVVVLIRVSYQKLVLSTWHKRLTLVCQSVVIWNTAKTHILILLEILMNHILRKHLMIEHLLLHLRIAIKLKLITWDSIILLAILICIAVLKSFLSAIDISLDIAQHLLFLFLNSRFIWIYRWAKVCSALIGWSIFVSMIAFGSHSFKMVIWELWKSLFIKLKIALKSLYWHLLRHRKTRINPIYSTLSRKLKSIIPIFEKKVVLWVLLEKVVLTRFREAISCVLFVFIIEIFHKVDWICFSLFLFIWLWVFFKGQINFFCTA